MPQVQDMQTIAFLMSTFRTLHSCLLRATSDVFAVGNRESSFFPPAVMHGFYFIRLVEEGCGQYSKRIRRAQNRNRMHRSSTMYHTVPHHIDNHVIITADSSHSETYIVWLWFLFQFYICCICTGIQLSGFSIFVCVCSVELSSTWVEPSPNILEMRHLSFMHLVRAMRGAEIPNHEHFLG